MRNFIRPLGLTPNLSHITRPSFRAAEIGEAVKHSSFSQNSFVQDRRLTVCSSIAAALHHHEGSCLIYEPLVSILFYQGFPVEYELDDYNTPHTGTTLSRLQYWLCWLRCKIALRRLATSSLGNIFWRHSRFSPKQPEPQTHGDYNSFSPQTANTTFDTLWRTHVPQHIQQCLYLTMHFSLRHLAAKMLSQLYHNCISFPYFFPSYEACSINVNPLFYAAIKNLHLKHFDDFSPLYT